jgi:peptide/nickel transport system substrate-binding protein
MLRLKKLIACVLLPTLVMSFAGCNKKTQSTVAAVSSTPQKSSSQAVPATLLNGNLSLPYTSVPYLNPLLPASAQNEALWPLIYDCLSEPSANYSPVMRLASSVTSSGTTATVKLKSGITFTDGSSLTGKDVVYSLNFVKSHTNSPYNAALSNISAITAQGLTVTLTLKSPDPLIANMLDVPIIKQYSDIQSDAIGSGRYSYMKNGVNATLSINKKWNGGSSAFSQISLINISESNAVMSSLAIGEVNYVFSDSGAGPAPAAVNTDTTSVNLNRLVFIGINTTKPHLNNPHFRRALSLSVDRGQLVSQTYSNRAAPSVLPFNPSLSILPASADKDITADYDTAASEMTIAGGAGSSSAAPLTLLVNQDDAVRVAAAKYVASCFGKAGVNVTVNSVPFSEYQSMISQGNFDMYIGETELANNMDISPLLAPGGASAFNVPANSATYAAFESWRAGSSNISEVISAFNNEMPFIPLCYRMGTTSYTRGLTGVTATSGDVFFDFEKWSYK